MNQEQIKEIMRLGELWAQRAWNGGKGDEDEITKIVPMRANLEAYLRTLRTDPPFQQRVQPWMLACFGEKIAADKAERNHRFLEEALELVQATGCTVGEAHQLVDYVYGRPVGEPVQEIGGVMVTLAALCLAHGIDMHSAAETELARIWTKVEQIRAKQAAKPKHSPLPEMVVMAQNTFPINPNGASKWARLQKHDGAQAIGVVFRTGTGSVGSLVDGRVVWADWLAHPNGSKPESVNAELLERISNAMQSYERHGAICMFEGSPMIYASTLTEIADIASEAQQVEKADNLVGLRGCNSRHGGIRSGYPCIYRMRTTDPGCTGCADRDEDQPTKAGDSILGEQK